MATRFRLFLPALIWWAFSWYLFTIPGKSLPTQSWMDKLQVDKIVHIFLFTVLLYWVYRPFVQGKLAPASKAFVVLMPVLAVLYGVAIEFIQLYFVANRGFDGWDMVADAAGCYLGWRLWASRAQRGATAIH